MFGFRKKKPEAAGLTLPRHIAVIMDGNGRWAKQRGLPRTAGHSVGSKVFESVCRYANSIGIECMTFYAFSTENWKRPKEEVDALMKIFGDYLRRAEQFQKENIRVRFVGDPSPLSEELRQLMKQAQEGSAAFTGMTVNLAINYGGRDELLHAVRSIGEEIKNGTVRPEQLGEEDLPRWLYTKEYSDVDLLIRPGGERRISNFLLWQIAYAELYFCDTLWPDFNAAELDRAIAWYSQRNRRFGGV